MHAPTRTAIYAAELRVVQAKQNTRDSLCSARVALRAALTRPSTLALAAGAAGILGFWLARRREPQATSAAGGAGVAKTTAALDLVLAFIARHVMQGLPFILQQVRAAWQKRAARANPDMSKSSATGDSATGVRQ
jgi:hypothetical protein